MGSRKPKHNSNFPSSPLLNLPSSSPSFSIFTDISNVTTPKQSSKAPNPAGTPQFFTACKNTPVSSVRRGVKPSALKSKAARRLKAFELEQSKSARKAQFEKEKSLKSLARSLTVWLNFLFENPSSCGCNPAGFTGEADTCDLSSGGVETKGLLVNNGKRAGESSCAVGVDGMWRGPKRQRSLSWNDEGGKKVVFPDSKFSRLKASLNEICSFDDLKDRMRMYVNLDTCIDIFEATAHVTKNIDEGRLKMRASCPIVSDVGMKEKAIRILMSYNQTWLRIGLYIIMGGESLLPNDNISPEQETSFLKMVIEKQFLTHPDLAKAYAYNKLVEGLYRPGYYEKLGNVILKRFFLLVMILDRAKAQTSLPLKYGIDGIDGGSPLLFYAKSNIKSSRQLVIDFLSSDVMHGEGNLLAHLGMVGFRVTYHQSPLIEYDFKVTDLFDDLKDGVRLCRAIELLRHDPSVLTKVVVPSDTQKKSLGNCEFALQYLKQAGIPLTDEDGTEVIAEDLVNGDKELILALLWNMFVHLQLPLLISRKLLLEEISNVRGMAMEVSSTRTVLDLVLSWIQAVCGTYKFKVENRSSLLDGKAMWCLLDYYFRKEQDCSCSFEEPDRMKTEVSIMSAIEYTDAVHNFLLTQKLTSLLGNFPEVLQVSDILEHNGASNAQTVIVLLVFLSVQLLVKRNMDKLNFHKLLGFNCQSPVPKRLSIEKNHEQGSKNFKVVMAWWQDMAQQNGKNILMPDAFSAQSFLSGRKSGYTQRENAAKTIQTHVRRFLKHQEYTRMRDAALTLQSAVLAWLSVKKKVFKVELQPRGEQRQLTSKGKHLEKYGKYVTLMADRHHFVKSKKSVIIIQRATRAWISQRRYQYALQKENASIAFEKDKMADLQTVAASKIQHYWQKFIHRKSIKCQQSAATKIQSHYRGWLTRKNFACKKQAIITIQSSWQRFIYRKSMKNQHSAAVEIQSHYHGWLVRRNFKCRKQATIKIQNSWRNFIHSRSFKSQHSAATKIQSHYRGWLVRKDFTCKKQAIITIQRSLRCLESQRNFQNQKVKNASATCIQSHFRGLLARRRTIEEKHLFIAMQRYCRRMLEGKELSLQKENIAARRIQSTFHSMKLHKAFISQRNAATDIQCFIRGETTRKRLLGTSSSLKTSNHCHELKIFLQSVVKLQRWWRNFLQAKRITKPAIIIQSHIRGWMARRMFKREKKQVILIQSYWKGYLARKEAKGPLTDLRTRMQKSAANIDENKRLINRLVTALSELLNKRSISDILHTCATLDVATELSPRCCEELVTAGAMDTLLKLIRSVSRSIPDQQVLKHALSTLRNLARYPHLTELLVETKGCVETIFLEFLKNKEEGYFIACELLKKICLSKNGLAIVRKSPGILKRLKNLVEEMTRKAGNDKRNLRNLVGKEYAEKRLRVASELLQIITKA